jgi:hypothetical protein
VDQAVTLCGFSLHGASEFALELLDVSDDGSRAKRIADLSFEEARLTSSVGGNCVRLFFAFRELCKPFSNRPLELDLLPRTHVGAWHLVEREAKLTIIDDLAGWIRHLAASVESLNSRGDGLDFNDLDAYLAGISRFNHSQNNPLKRVRVLLTNVQYPPKQIIEMPADEVFASYGYHVTFSELFDLYTNICSGLARRMLTRYASSREQDPLVVAFELCNEPDYEWLPDEQRIERAEDPAASPLSKYITELHPMQIPSAATVAVPLEHTPWHGFQEQSGNWVPTPQGRHIGVLEYDWGPKFDWYVKCYAQFSEQLSRALSEECKTRGLAFDIVAGGVTHNNLDYLIRMQRAVPTTFRYCSALALHPYHWPEHDVYDTKYRRRRKFDDWRRHTPREFAMHYFKCFDFFRELRKLTHGRAGLRGFKGKKLWLTEFGIGSKLLGAYNEPVSSYTPFIRPRGMPAEALPYASRVWEDCWDAFLATVKPRELKALGVEAMFFYTLRETASPGLDKHDDDRSNLAILRRDGFPRLDLPTFRRLVSFIHEFTGQPAPKSEGLVSFIHRFAGQRRPKSEVEFKLVPAWTRGRRFSLPLLKTEPWRYINAPPSVLDTLSMLSRDEKQFLYWLTKEYFTGNGEIVDGGCFVGGSTVSLATGLMENWPEDTFRVHSYDIFLTDPYMAQWYFRDRQPDGDRFRKIFDEQTLGVKTKLIVNDGDIMSFGWNDAPIEILFLDICKSWQVNDYCMRTFFPRLIPGQSLVIQQDFFHHAEGWIIAAMELLYDKFEYIAFVPGNSAVFRLKTAIDANDLPAELRQLGLPRLQELMRRHAERYSDGFQRGMILAALAAIYNEFGDRATALESAHEALAISGEAFWVAEGLRDVGLL